MLIYRKIVFTWSRQLDLKIVVRMPAPPIRPLATPAPGNKETISLQFQVFQHSYLKRLESSDRRLDRILLLSDRPFVLPLNCFGMGADCVKTSLDKLEAMSSKLDDRRS